MKRTECRDITVCYLAHHPTPFGNIDFKVSKAPPFLALTQRVICPALFVRNAASSRLSRKLTKGGAVQLSPSARPNMDLCLWSGALCVVSQVINWESRAAWWGLRSPLIQSPQPLARLHRKLIEFSEDTALVKQSYFEIPPRPKSKERLVDDIRILNSAAFKVF